MTKKPQDKKIKVEDEPGAEGRFMRSIRKALKTPHKPHKDEPKRRKDKTKGKKHD